MRFKSNGKVNPSFAHSVPLAAAALQGFQGPTHAPRRGSQVRHGSGAQALRTGRADGRPDQRAPHRSGPYTDGHRF